MSEKVEDIEQRIYELEQVKIALKEKELTEQRRAERLKLLDHPFVKKVRNMLHEAAWVSSEKIRKEAYAQIDKNKLEVLENLHKQVTWILKENNAGIGEKQLTDMLTKILAEEKKVEDQNKTGVV